MPSLEDIQAKLEHAAKQQARGAAVLIPLIETEVGLEVLFEQRALNLDVQPGEVSFPGGHLEPGESPREAALRECEEELLISRDSIELLGELGNCKGPGGSELFAFVGVLHDYKQSFSPAEVEQVFCVPLDYFLEHEPQVFELKHRPEAPDDFPFELISENGSYPWRPFVLEIPFYLETEPLIWGLTARVMKRFVDVLLSIARAGFESATFPQALAPRTSHDETRTHL